MEKTGSAMIIILVVMCLNIFASRVHGQCIEECIKKCDEAVDEKFRYGEGYMKDIKSSSNYLIMKNQERTKCYKKCNEECSQRTKKDEVNTNNKLKKKPKEK